MNQFKALDGTDKLFLRPLTEISMEPIQFTLQMRMITEDYTDSQRFVVIK